MSPLRNQPLQKTSAVSSGLIEVAIGNHGTAHEDFTDIAFVSSTINPYVVIGKLNTNRILFEYIAILVIGQIGRIHQ